MGIGTRGKLIEGLAYQQIFAAAEKSGAATLFNDAADTVTTSAIDTQGFDELNIIVNTGTFNGDGTVDLAVFESAANLPSAATAVALATIVQIGSANDEGQFIGSLLSKNRKRFIWLRSVTAGTGTLSFSAHAVQGKARNNPQTNVTESFDIN